MTDSRVSKHPQSAASSYPTDYLRRLIRGAVDESPTDQAFLQGLRAWIDEQHASPASPSTAGAGFIEMLHDQPHAASLLEHFASMLSDDLVLPLAEQLIACSVKKFRNAAHFGSSNAHVAIWRIAHHRKGKIDSVSRFLRRQLRACVPVSLELARDLKYYWASKVVVQNPWSEKLGDTIDRSGQLRRCAGQRLNALCQKLLPNPVAWLKVLPPQRPANAAENQPPGRNAYNEYILYHLMRWHEDDTPPDQWSWAVGPLLGAADSEPARVVPVLRALLMRSEDAPETWENLSEGNGFPPRVYFLDEDFLHGWCPHLKNQRRLLTLLAGEVYPTSEADLNAMNQAVRGAAKALLDRLPSDPPDPSDGESDEV